MANPERLDLLDGDFYVNDPYPTYAWMRDNEPVYWDEVNEIWGVSRYDDIIAIERDKFRFTNSGNEKGGYRPNIPADASIIGLDDPHHMVRRNLVSRRFTPRAAGNWEDHVRGVVTGLLDDLAETMFAAPGIGLAAVQVGVSKRMLVAAVPIRDGLSREEEEDSEETLSASKESNRNIEELQ